MRQKFICLLIVIPFSLSLMGCATIATSISPLESELVTKTASRKTSYKYSLITDERNKLYVSKTPYCSETAKAYRFASKKSEIGLPIALAELVLFGFGLVDYAGALAVEESTKAEYLLGEFETGIPKKCGGHEKVSGEAIIIENREHRIYHEVYTDQSGAIDLKSVLGDVDNALKLNIYPKSDHSSSFSYIYSKASFSRN